MAIYAVSIRKDIPWRGARATFGNVYHYKTDPGEPFDDVGVINRLLTLEKAIHSSEVKFLQGRSWGPITGNKADSVMREIIDFSNQAGSLSSNPAMYPELCFMVYWPLGRYGSRNRPQFMRKWLRLDTAHGYTAAQIAGRASIGGIAAAIQTYINGVQLMDTGVPGMVAYPLCTHTGRERVESGKLYPYMEHRQLGK